MTISIVLIMEIDCLRINFLHLIQLALSERGWLENTHTVRYTYGQHEYPALMYTSAEGCLPGQVQCSHESVLVVSLQSWPTVVFGIGPV